MTYKEFVPTNYHASKSQRDILYALGDNLYTTERVAKRHESVGKAQVVTPKELQSKMKEYFGHQPKGLTDYPKEKNKNYRIFSATPEGVKAAEKYTNSSLEDRRKSDAKWIKNTADLLNKRIEENSFVNSTALKICALQAAQNEVSEESKAADQHYLRVKKAKENAAKNRDIKNSVKLPDEDRDIKGKTVSDDGPEL